MLADRLLSQAGNDAQRLDLLFTLLASRKPTERERNACMTLLQSLRERYQDAEADALALLATGTLPRNEKLDPVEHAAWSLLATTVLASDIALLLY